VIGRPWPAGSRRKRALVLLLAALTLGASWPGRAAPTPPGGTVRVTAGEHGDFSRVVFPLGAGLRYRTEVEPRGLRIVLPDALVGFDYEEVYPKRRAHRVVAAEPVLDGDGVSLRLRFGCACSARTSMLGGKLVVDVFDAAPDAAAPARGPAPAQPVRSEPRPRSEPPAAAPAAPRQAVPSAPGSGQPRPEFVQRVQGLDSSAPRPAPPAEPGRAEFDPEHLQRMLTWAIEHGHLSEARTPESVSPPARPHDARTSESVLPPPARAHDAPPAAAPSASDGEGASGPAAAAPATPETVPSSACPEGAALDLVALGGKGSFADEHARRQDALSRALAAERGVPEARHALAGFYIARLMPHEALAALRGAAEDAAPTRIWLEAAALVLADRASELAPEALRDASCAGVDARLWRTIVLAAQGALPNGTFESPALARRLAEYPRDLRIELGLRLAEAALEAAASETVARLLDLVEAAAPADQAQARLLFLRGRLAAARGDFAAAEASWREAAALTGEGALRATLELVAAGLNDADLDVAGALAALERLAYDWRRHPLQLRIAQLTAAIHERRGEPVRALGVLEEVALHDAGRPNGRAAVLLANDLMRRTYGEAAEPVPVDQMSAFWRYEGFMPPGGEGAGVRLAFARALLAEGLPGPAIGLLEPLLGTGDASADAIDLLAEGYLRANRPEQALGLLRDAAGNTAEARPARNRLAARALAALGRFAEAAGLLHDDAGERAARQQADYLWRAGLWSEAAAAYRALLQDAEGGADAEVAIRLAAAAHMAGRPALLESAAPAVAAAGDDVALSAFAPMPVPGHGKGAARAAAARLLEQAQGLEALARRYSLGTPEGQ
jgi:hypothetical protein